MPIASFSCQPSAADLWTVTESTQQKRRTTVLYFWQGAEAKEGLREPEIVREIAERRQLKGIYHKETY